MRILEKLTKLFDHSSWPILPSWEEFDYEDFYNNVMGEAKWREFCKIVVEADAVQIADTVTNTLLDELVERFNPNKCNEVEMIEDIHCSDMQDLCMDLLSFTIEARNLIGGKNV